ncbi:triose-phosphate isomerase [Basilea psittacipulmonis]|uniref:Triosephosphate isomerase n=1 Tax=Basilea psittacipulmonis DSM 24701 TaxID=1072685 RepID=A0A077DGQ2_9BURK|nr:triose-phosphate isomerase [Basilea psittacipulmonis]AIL32348.1 triosephosphate isomerase [Basilea psittacipulmonis DSM 24701]
MSVNRRLIMANWKMHGDFQSNKALLEGISQRLTQCPEENVDIALCVPFPYLHQVQELLQGTNISWGSQDVSAYDKGAYTGQVSAHMLKEFGCSWSLVGHSERRQYQGETNEEVAHKALRAIECGITPVVCIGETEKDYKDNLTLKTIKSQLDPILNLGEDLVNKMVFAYEPVWAIGTGLSATPEQAQIVHEHIREWVGQNRIIYGGSVKPSNAANLFKMKDIDGVLVGGASLFVEDFLGIVRA